MGFVTCSKAPWYCFALLTHTLEGFKRGKEKYFEKKGKFHSTSVEMEIVFYCSCPAPAVQNCSSVLEEELCTRGTCKMCEICKVWSKPDFQITWIPTDCGDEWQGGNCKQVWTPCFLTVMSHGLNWSLTRSQIVAELYVKVHMGLWRIIYYYYYYY